MACAVCSSSKGQPHLCKGADNKRTFGLPCLQQLQVDASPVRGLVLLSKAFRMSSPIVKTPVRSLLLGSVLEYHGSCTATNSHLQGSVQVAFNIRLHQTATALVPRLCTIFHDAERMTRFFRCQVVQGHGGKHRGAKAAVHVGRHLLKGAQS